METRKIDLLSDVIRFTSAPNMKITPDWIIALKQVSEKLFCRENVLFLLEYYKLKQLDPNSAEWISASQAIKSRFFNPASFDELNLPGKTYDDVAKSVTPTDDMLKRVEKSVLSLVESDTFAKTMNDKTLIVTHEKILQKAIDIIADSGDNDESKISKLDELFQFTELGIQQVERQMVLQNVLEKAKKDKQPLSVIDNISSMVKKLDPSLSPSPQPKESMSDLLLNTQLDNFINRIRQLPKLYNQLEASRFSHRFHKPKHNKHIEPLLNAINLIALSNAETQEKLRKISATLEDLFIESQQGIFKKSTDELVKELNEKQGHHLRRMVGLLLQDIAKYPGMVNINLPEIKIPKVGYEDFQTPIFSPAKPTADLKTPSLKRGSREL